MFAIPLMTMDGLIFALVMVGYMRFGLWFEERALLREYGAAYEQYQREIPMLIPRVLPSRHTSLTQAINQIRK